MNTEICNAIGVVVIDIPFCVSDQRLIFGTRMLPPNRRLSDYNIGDGSTVHVMRRLQSAPGPHYIVKLEKKNCDHLLKIKFSAEQFVRLFNNININIKLPKPIVDMIFLYTRTIGGQRNVNLSNSFLYIAAKKGDLDKCVALLAEKNLYIDEWTLVYSRKTTQTPLIHAIYSGNIILVETLLLNGARRKIKQYFKQLIIIVIMRLKIWMKILKKKLLVCWSHCWIKIHTSMITKKIN